MSSKHPQQFHSCGWHDDARTPVVDGKYYDRATGNVQIASNHQEYMGPPAVDIIVKSQHQDTSNCTYRAARAFPVEVLLCQMMRVVADDRLEIDSLMATPYAIRIILSHELTEEGFYAVADRMANGVWD